MLTRKALAKLKPALVKLEIDVADAPSIEAIGELSRLESLHLRGYAMNLAPLAKLTRLRHLELHLDRSVKGLDHLASLVELRSLAIEESAIADLGICRGMSKLVELTIVGGLQRATGIAGAPRLEKLTLARTQITSLAPLAPLTRLRELTLRFSRKLADLAGIEKLRQLRVLDLYEVRGPIKSLAPLTKLTRLTGLDLSLTPIVNRDLSPLYKVRSLKAIGGEASPAQLAALAKHLPRTKLFLDVDEDADDCIEVGPIQVYKPNGGEPWTIRQDLVDDLEVTDQNDVEELIAREFKKAKPALHRKITFDSEGDAFVAMSSDRAAIMALAKLIEHRIDAVGGA